MVAVEVMHYPLKDFNFHVHQSFWESVECVGYMCFVQCDIKTSHVISSLFCYYLGHENVCLCMYELRDTVMVSASKAGLTFRYLRERGKLITRHYDACVRLELKSSCNTNV